MDECYTKGEVRYYGLNKLDSKVIENKKKKDVLAALELNYTMLLLKARKNLIQIKVLKKKVEDMTQSGTKISKQDDINKANSKIELLKEENKIIKEKLDKLKKNKK